MANPSCATAAKRYAEAVVGGDIVVGKWVRLACQRQLDDLNRFKGKDVPYRFNPPLKDRTEKPFRPADNVCAFIERQPHIKGPLAGQLIKLEPWQVFVLATVFGWVKRRSFNSRTAGGKAGCICWQSGMRQVSVMLSLPKTRLQNIAICDEATVIQRFSSGSKRLSSNSFTSPRR